MFFMHSLKSSESLSCSTSSESPLPCQSLPPYLSSSALAAPSSAWKAALQARVLNFHLALHLSRPGDSCLELDHGVQLLDVDTVDKSRLM